MGDLKYVMFRCKSASATMPDRLVPFVFPDFMVHSDCRDYLTMWLKREHRFVEAKPVTAGFYRPGNPSVTYGESETLGLKSRPEDSAVIDSYPYTHGIDPNPRPLPTQPNGKGLPSTPPQPRPEPPKAAKPSLSAADASDAYAAEVMARLQRQQGGKSAR